jgi:hypothetical protein
LAARQECRLSVPMVIHRPAADIDAIT